ncbi:hypothetical protein [Clostridium perfringens]|uniref:hypothetical protein n=1 Tax=Clostridium perfringens TaxID=1502 RepID=UPI0032DA84DE
MKIGLASKEFINKDIEKNTNTIIETMIEAKEENYKGLLYCSYMTINENGEIINNFKI